MTSNRYLGFWESAFRPREPIPRSYWWGYMLLLNVIPVALLLVLAGSVIEVVDLLFGLDASVIQKAVLLLGPDIFEIVALVTFVLGIIATIQRLRDLGESPWNVLWLFVPFANVVILVLCGFVAGKSPLPRMADTVPHRSNAPGEGDSEDSENAEVSSEAAANRYQHRHPDFGLYPSKTPPKAGPLEVPSWRKRRDPVRVARQPEVRRYEGELYLRVPLSHRPVDEWHTAFQAAYGPAILRDGWLLYVPLPDDYPHLDAVVDDVLDGIEAANNAVAGGRRRAA